ncbi:hypothetical protein COLO4_07860 [Corchorus olitorius]|uniref:Uncharacterized protein n=1 Tax=Corchorus olitorius TaxID=93759 RepID=A0A1R3KIC2_9ROSI|nr:hypothetical protein COLO4_07860 [Corchorus olitorius]
MAWKVSHLLFSFLWLSLLLLLLHEFHNFKFKINSKQATPLITRKVVTTKFDFTPFQKHHHQHKQDKHYYNYSPQTKKHSDPGDDTEIDPRYGVQKRLVPTGPNPLHH